MQALKLKFFSDYDFGFLAGIRKYTVLLIGHIKYLNHWLVKLVKKN